MNFIHNTFGIASTEILMLILACIALVMGLFSGKRSEQVVYAIVQFTLLLGFSLSLKALPHLTTSLGFNDAYISDPVSLVLKIFITLSGFLAFIYSRYYVKQHQLPSAEYYILGLFSILGMMVLVSGHTLLTIYLGLELMSLPLYAMIGLQRNVPVASEASMKYFVMGAMTSGILLYGMSFLYGLTGSLNLTTIVTVMQLHHANHALLLGFAGIFILVAVSFKLAIAPFHMWAPDVYTGAPTSVTLFLATLPKLAAFGMLVRLLINVLLPLGVITHEMLMVLAILSIFLGNVLAIAQKNIKRMLAYSGISHAGYLFLGLVPGLLPAYQASLFYVITYALMGLAAFGILVVLSQPGNEIEYIDDLQGLSNQQPWLAFLLMIVMFSMAGVPPTLGFLAKFLIFQSLVQAKYVLLAVIGLLLSIVGAYYYLRIVKTMYFDEGSQIFPVAGNKAMKLILSFNGLALLGLGIFPGILIQLCQVSF